MTDLPLGEIGSPGFSRSRGVVSSFDADVGLGTVEAEGRRWLFHCTAISDGTRVIDIGAIVDFAQSFGGPGRWEAFDLVTVGGAQDR